MGSRFTVQEVWYITVDQKPCVYIVVVAWIPFAKLVYPTWPKYESVPSLVGCGLLWYNPTFDARVRVNETNQPTN